MALAAGVVAGSTALVGFGGDSIVESLSGAILIWRLTSERRPGGAERAEAVERRARRAVAISLWVLAAYVAAQAVAGLVGGAGARGFPRGHRAGGGLAGRHVAAGPGEAVPGARPAQPRPGGRRGADRVVLEAVGRPAGGPGPERRLRLVVGRRRRRPGPVGADCLRGPGSLGGAGTAAEPPPRPAGRASRFGWGERGSASPSAPAGAPPPLPRGRPEAQCPRSKWTWRSAAGRWWASSSTSEPSSRWTMPMP